MELFKCKKCNNIISILKKGTCVPNCCGEEMTQLVANTVDAAVEKHVPIVSYEGSVAVVTCGSVMHPMEENHYIEFMLLETNKGEKVEHLFPGDQPICRFALEDDEKVLTAYAYCNLHGLWKSE